MLSVSVYELSIDSMRKKLGANVWPVLLPLGKEDYLKGQLDIINKKAIIYSDSDDQGSVYEITDIPNEHKAVVDKAYKTGASKVIVEDLREEFLSGYVFPALKAGAVYEHKYLLGTSLARPVIAKHQVEVALREGATAVAHGCTGKGNDQVRFELTYQALAPELKIIAPWREWSLKSREDCLDYAEAHGIPVAASREKIHSRDRNLWHLSHEGGELEDAGNAANRDTNSPRALS